MSWPVSALGSLLKADGGLLQTGPFGSQLKQAEYTDYGVPVVMPKDIENGQVNSETVARVPQSTADRLSRHKIRVNGIVLPRRGAVTKRAFIGPDEEGWLCGTGCIKIETTGRRIWPKYLYYYLGTAESIDWLEKNAVGSTMLNLSTEIVSRFPLACPDIRVQKQIAASLSAYDDLIENNQRRIALLEEAARLLYRKWFVQYRFPGHEHLNFIDNLPEGWERSVPNSIIANHIGGGWGKDEPTGKESEPAFVVRGTDIPRVENGDITSVNLRFHSPTSLRSRILMPYDIVFEVSGGSSTQPVARTLLLTEERLKLWNAEVICASFCKRFTFDKAADALYFVFHIREHRDRGDVLVFQKESASSLKNFNFQAFINSYEFSLPPSSLRKSFFQSIDPIVRQQSILAAQTQQLAKARDLLLPRLMSGELLA